MPRRGGRHLSLYTFPLAPHAPATDAFPACSCQGQHKTPLSRTSFFGLFLIRWDLLVPAAPSPLLTLFLMLCPALLPGSQPSSLPACCSPLR